MICNNTQLSQVVHVVPAVQVTQTGVPVPPAHHVPPVPPAHHVITVVPIDVNTFDTRYSTHQLPQDQPDQPQPPQPQDAVPQV